MSNLARIPAVSLCALLIVTGASVTGCASAKKTKQEMKVHEERIEELEEHAEKTDEHFVQVEKKIEEFSETAREALERAKELGEANTLIDEVVLREDLTQFASGSAKLSDRAKSYLTEFAEKLKTDNVAVYIEIQGHTDGVGDKQSNLRLGQRRADAVYDFLAKEGGLPLHRMRTISYGEDKPLADNGSPDGRAKNRRVVLVVLK